MRDGAVAAVDLAAIRRNLELLSARAAPAKVMAVVKADAYGHGLVEVARAAIAAGIDWLGTLDVSSALELRSNGVGEDVGLFAWFFDLDEDFAPAIDAGIDLGVSTVWQLEQIASAGAERRARVHLKVDTGLHRGGARAEEWPELVASALARRDRLDTVGVWSHLAEASDSDDDLSIEQFRAAIAEAERLGASFTLRHIAASAPAYGRPSTRFDLVRIGAFAYGIAPGDGVTAASLGLEPAMTLSAPVVDVTGSIARIAVGFGDGLSSAAAGRAELSIRGRRFPIDEVAVDCLTITVDEEGVLPGDTAILFGPGSRGEPTLQEWGDRTGTIGEEIVVRLAPSLPRVFTSD